MVASLSRFAADRWSNSASVTSVGCVASAVAMAGFTATLPGKRPTPIRHASGPTACTFSRPTILRVADARLAPVGILEAELADRVAVLLWRLRRVVTYETAVTSDQMAMAAKFRADAESLGLRPALVGHDDTGERPRTVRAIREELDLARRWAACSAARLADLEAVGALPDPAPVAGGTAEGLGRFDTAGGPGDAAVLRTGQVLGERYEVRGEVGRGGMGVVYAALDRTTGDEVAVKVLLPHLLRNPDARTRFAAEAASRLSHPHIVRMLGRHDADGCTFLTMGLLRGTSLRAELVGRQKRERRFSVDEVRHVAGQLCDALTYAHSQGVVHRDIKPENIWLDEEGAVKLMDFGIARLLTPAQFTSTGVALGTAYYMAPEQLKGRADVDHRADQYAAGVMLYELLTGDVPQGVIRPPYERRRGDAYLKKKDYRAAIEDFTAALRIDSVSTYADEAYRGRGFARFRSKDGISAVIDFDSALQLNPKDVTTLVEKGVVSDDNDQAIECFNEAIRLDPTNGRAYYNRGIAKANTTRGHRVAATRRLVRPMARPVGLVFPVGAP